MKVTPISSIDNARIRSYRPESTLFSELVKSHMKKASVR